MSPDSPSRAASDDQDLSDYRTNATQATTAVIEAALDRFSRLPFAEAKLSDIARESGMSKRMIHYYFSNKRDLYRATLAEAVSRLQPSPEAMAIDSAIPVEGVRRIIDALNDCYLAHPEAVAMIRMENLQRVLPLADMPPLVDHTPVILRLDRLLLVGQDAGAFRPGISAYDVYFLVVALLGRRIVDQSIPRNIHGTDMNSQANIEGVQRMTVDAVLAFLTANISDAGHDSYLSAEHVHPTENANSGTAPAVYGEEHASSAIYRTP